MVQIKSGDTLILSAIATAAGENIANSSIAEPHASNTTLNWLPYIPTKFVPTMICLLNRLHMHFISFHSFSFPFYLL